jgi:DNA-binding NtrC family response regulator
MIKNHKLKLSHQAEIAIISKEVELREKIKGFLSTNGHRTHTFSAVPEVLGQAGKFNYNLLILDAQKSEWEREVLHLKEALASAKVILIAESVADPAVQEIIKGKVEGCIFKPVREAEVRLEVNRIVSGAGGDISAGGDKDKFVFTESRNLKMAELYQAAVSKIARSDATVLISGPSGTGKELMAHWIYAHSQRKGKPFIKVSCAVLPEGVLESELFGHEKGSFTGAYTKRKGRFELADGGTIFLDEIGEISPGLQSKFLRVLQEREFQRVGSSETIKVNVRIIAATSRNLKKEVEAGRFREDLYYRLNVINIAIPPLRERKEDIYYLAQMFLDKFACTAEKRISRIEEKAVKLLCAYDWPGNVRELENAIEWAVVMCSGDEIKVDDLPSSIIQQLGDEAPADLTLKKAREIFEREYITDTLSRFSGNVSRSSKYLGLARKNLQEKIKKYEINARKYR